MSRRITPLRLLLALLLVLSTHVAGMGRALSTAASDVDVIPSIPGVATVICHVSRDGEPAPGLPQHHDCCDDCALCAPVLLPAGPDLTAPAAVARFADHARAVAWAPSLSRFRTPRLAQGPPAA